MDQHVAQFNVARMRFPDTDPRFQTFTAQLVEINALADSAPGFVWRLQTEDGDATSIRPFGDMMLVNLSVWESVDHIREFTYRTDHLRVLRQRADWFEIMDTPHLVLWFVPAGHEPTMAESAERLAHLQENGPTATAFTFATVPQPSEAVQD